MRRLLAAALIGVGAFAAWSWHAGSTRSVAGQAAGTAAPIPPGAETEDVTCYFPARTGMDLIEEVRHRVKGAPAEDRLRGALQMLHQGPTNPAALPVFPAGLVPRSVFLTPEGAAYLDEPAAAWNRPVGLREEMLGVRAIARTLLRQCPEIRSLVFLTDGAPRTRLSTHLSAQGRFVLPRLRRPRAAPRPGAKGDGEAPDAGADAEPAAQ